MYILCEQTKNKYTSVTSYMPNKEWVGRAAKLFIFVYWFIYFFDWREKSQPWAQVSVDKSAQERKN